MVLDRAVGVASRWLRLDVEYYSRATAYLVLGQVCVALSSLAASMLFVRLSSQDIYGQYNYVLSVLGLLSILSLPGMSTAMARSVARGYDQVFVRGVRTRLTWGLLGSVVALTIGLYYIVVKGSTTLGGSFIIASLIFPLFVAGDSYNALLNGRREFCRLSLYQAASAVVGGAGVTVGVYSFPNNLLGIVALSLASYAGIHGVFLWRTFRRPLNRESEDGSLGFGRHMTVQGTVDTVAQYSDKIVVGLLLTFSELAVYSIALTVMLVEKVVYLPLVPMFPRLAQLEERVAFREVRRRLPLGMLGFGLACGVAALAAQVLIPLVYTAKYSASVPYAQLLILSVFLGAPCQVVVQLFKSQRRVGDLYRLTTSTAAIQIVLTTALVLPFGLAGVVWARVAVQAIRSGIAWVLLVRSRSPSAVS